MQDELITNIIQFDNIDAANRTESLSILSRMITTYFSNLLPNIKKIIITADVNKIKRSLNESKISDPEAAKASALKVDDLFYMIFNIDSIGNNHIIYHEFQHIKNDVTFRSFYELEEKKKFINTMEELYSILVTKLFDEYYAYYETQLIYPIDIKEKIDDFNSNCACFTYKDLLPPEIKRSQEFIDLQLPQAVRTIYSFAAALGYVNAYNIMNNTVDRLIFPDNSLKRVLTNFQTTLEMYQNDPDSEGAVLRLSNRLNMGIKEYIKLFLC